jgi:hypothetical protein
VSEQAVADHGDGEVARQLERVGATGRESGGAAARVLGQSLCYRRCAARKVGEGREALRRNVAKVEAGVHQLVIAVEHDQLTARLVRLDLELLEHVEHFAVLVSAVQLIAGLHDREIFADPAIVAVDGAGQPERGAQGVQVTVDIADGDEP